VGRGNLYLQMLWRAMEHLASFILSRLHQVRQWTRLLVDAGFIHKKG